MPSLGNDVTHLSQFQCQQRAIKCLGWAPGGPRRARHAELRWRRGGIESEIFPSLRSSDYLSLEMANYIYPFDHGQLFCYRGVMQFPVQSYRDRPFVFGCARLDPPRHAM